MSAWRMQFMKHVLPRLIRPLNPIVESSETLRLLGLSRKRSASSIDGVQEMEAEENGKDSLRKKKDEEEEWEEGKEDSGRRERRGGRGVWEGGE